MYAILLERLGHAALVQCTLFESCVSDNIILHVTVLHITQTNFACITDHHIILHVHRFLTDLFNLLSCNNTVMYILLYIYCTYQSLHEAILFWYG